MKAKQVRSQQSGFTLIELVAVIVILGILAATAVPRFINLQDEAAQAAVNGIAGSMESASALNHAVAIAVGAGLTSASSDPFFNVDNCTDAGGLLQHGSVPSGYAVTPAAISPPDTATCTITHTASGLSSTFVLIGVNETGGDEL